VFDYTTMNSTPQKPFPHAIGTSPASDPRPLRRHHLSKPWPWVVAVVGGLVLFYGVEGYLGCASMIGENPRWRGINRGPQDFGLKGEVVSLRSQDGLSLRAWWLPAEGKPKANIIIAHGIDHTRQVMLPRATFLVSSGYNVLAVDLRGHGESAAQYASPDIWSYAIFLEPFSTSEHAENVSRLVFWESRMER
jgi:pimeloyl-ACP methyl ester carboxylesterase